MKAGKWLRNILAGKKKKNEGRNILLPLHNRPHMPPPSTPPTTPNGRESMRSSIKVEKVHLKHESKKENAKKKLSFTTVQQVAAIKIQAYFRSFLARKALRALKGVVKLQALVRGFLVRKEAVATIRSMQALLTVQVRARAQRVRMTQQQFHSINQSKFQQYSSSHDMERNTSKNIVDTSIGQSKANSKKKKKNNNPTTQIETKDQRFFKYHNSSLVSSPNINEMISRSHNETKTFFTTSGISSQHSLESKSNQEKTYLISQDYSFSPNYMTNTKSSKAKARSQSTPRQRNDFFDSKQYGKQRVSVDGRSIGTKEKIKLSQQFDKLVSNIDYYI